MFIMSVAAIKVPEKIIDKNYCDTQGLLKDNPVYKPFRYPWCYDAWLTQQRIHWLPEEVPLSEDIRDWQKKLTQSEKNLLTQIFRFFTQADVDAFTEGLQLFASFAILLNFPRFNKMKGMGQIVTWSVRDETLHCNSMIKIFNTFCDENPGLLDESLKKEIYDACRTIVHHEDAFIDLAFEMGNIEGLTAEQVKTYIRWIANRRLSQLRLKEIYEVKENPLTWLDDMLNGVEHMNFFEGRATEYSKASTKGSWVEAFEFTK
ncbi:MAG: ribonucleotide-diphosphate reductase subunit beta [Proteobacteria bacterium]|nr:ribonucleotide-diphosphate reductase subunit beta [Pseudomonadota bacterium]